jgi:hypothetical protein
MEELTVILLKIVGVCMALAAASAARAFWYAGTHALYDRECDKRSDEIERLENEIMLALVRCATYNPDAAAILSVREKARQVPYSSPWRTALREFYFDFDVGGEPRDERVTSDESANQQNSPRDDAVTDLFTGLVSDESAKPEEDKP